MHTPLLPLAFAFFAPQDSTPRLRIDPLLVAQVAEVYALIADDGDAGWSNPVWPGWDASDTPILLYLPDVQDVLLNHPRPPAGFVDVDATELLPDGWTMSLRNGQTTFALDGQNTSTGIAGIETLVVADPISNLRPSLEQIIRGTDDAHEKEASLTSELLATDPYDELSFVVHEAFHVHQFRQAANKAANEALLQGYPWLDAENLAGFALEGRCLERALRADNLYDVYAAAFEFLAVRRERRSKLSQASIQYEDGTEFSEGLAKYTEWALSRAIEGRAAGAPMRWARDFHGYANLGFWRDELLRNMRTNMDGDQAVNGTPYGAGGLRFRLYFSGMAIGAMLDALEADGWHERVFEPGTTLTSIVHEVLSADDGTLEPALADARAKGNWSKLVDKKRAFEAAGRAAARSQADAILASRPRFTLDYSALPDTSVSWSYTPFGQTKLDNGMIYDSIPLSASFGQRAHLKQDHAIPALHDTATHQVHFQLPERPDGVALPLGFLESAEFDLPGVSLSVEKGELQSEGGVITLRLLP